MFYITYFIKHINKKRKKKDTRLCMCELFFYLFTSYIYFFISDVYFDNALRVFAKSINSTINARFDRLEKMICSKNTLGTKTNSNKYKDLFPLKSFEHINDFEQKLADQIFYNEMVSFLRRVNGSGKEWRPSCYTLCDTMFTKY